MAGTPSLRDVRVDSALTNLAIAYFQKPGDFIANKVAPLVPVNRVSGKYFVHSKADMMRDEAKRRAPGQRFARVGGGVTTDSYTCEEFSLEYALPDEIRANWDSPLKADQAAIRQLMQQLMIRRERQFATTALAASVWGTDVAGAASNPGATEHIFFDNASADIIGTLSQWSDEVKKQTGFRPNRFVTTPDVIRVMKNDADIIDRHKYTSAEPISLRAIANLCNIGSAEDPGEIVEMGASYNTAAENATASMSFMAGDVGLLMYVAPSPQIDAPSALYTFSWSDFDRSVSEAGAAAIDMYREEGTRSDIYRGQAYFDIKVAAADCGVYFSNLLT